VGFYLFKDDLPKLKEKADEEQFEFGKSTVPVLPW
jgi:hypothetical protein